MKKKYTRKQISEAIAYWEKQLKKGNYKKVNESFSFGKKYDHTDPELGDQYPGGSLGPALSWGELKAAVDKQLSDDDQVDNIALICGPEDVELGIGLAYVDVDKNNDENTLVFSITGY